MEKFKLDAFQIKLFMAFLMVFDHIYMINNLIPNNLVVIFHVATRVVGVWFAYNAVEGFLYTSNLKKYITRLFLWALLMFTGNSILRTLFQSKGIVVNNNIFLTLAIGVLMLSAIKKINHQVLKYIVTFILLILGILIAEGGIVILPFMLITYLTYGKNKDRNMIYIVFSVVLFSMSFVDYGNIVTTINMLAYNCDFMFILILPFLYIYNGKRGNSSKFSKYFFYVFYPAHLWIIATIAYIVAT